MLQMVTRILPRLAMLGMAALAALVLAHVAHADLGLSPDAIRTDALFLALVLSGLLIVAIFSGHFGKRGP